MEKEQATFIKSIFESEKVVEEVMAIAAEGLVVVDMDGVLIYANKSFEQIYRVPKIQALGKHVTEVIENTRLHIVARTRVAEVDQIQFIGGHKYVVSRMPIMVADRCVGIAGKIRFKDTCKVKELTRRISNLETRLNSNRESFYHPRYTFQSMVAYSEISHKAKEMAIRASASKATVLLLGESGVGKEVFAQSIHNMSSRNAGPFVMLNCSAIQESLFESELFGYVAGAFTGAKKQGKKGKFELADSGTIFLDEIGEMPLNSQAKLLRVMQEKTIDKVGGEKIYNVDVRIVAATNKDLEQLVRQGKFRKDLFYRLNVITIHIPPLRQRPTDIPQLIRFLWKQLEEEYGIYHKRIDHEAMNLFQNYDWPGNVRELRNVLERLMVLVPQASITAEHARTLLAGQEPSDASAVSRYQLRHLVSQTEKTAISQALVTSNANRSRAAKALGISRALLYKKMHLYGLMDA
ncbi:MAG: sigma 54-interacting transcriptional regulator [Desulfobacter sp.]|nr:MAG: sigma 54-interacting transcriptional regulator [Desulfobacter sp.]